MDLSLKLLFRLLVLAALLAAASCSTDGCSRRARAPNAPSDRAALDEKALRARLQLALEAKGPGYAPHTRHKHADGSPKYTNRLILEASPYLVQHAHNPVDWYAWGEEAFERAKKTGRPIFLSVGYSTCHWCHVMEEESFEDEAIAAYINQHYVPIKVDREERPDIDGAYMGFVQSLTGGGGWPMSVWLTPDREPFFGGTYFPPRSGVRGARRGFLELLKEQAARFRDSAAEVATDAKGFVARMREATAPLPAADFPAPSLMRASVEQAKLRFDPEFGGSRGAPKFPSSFPVRLLLRYARRARDAEATRMASVTLERMREGGIYDQIGGGFHRYSTDRRWLVPHFEKMLYDNALLASVYLEAAQATGNRDFTRVARETLDYLLREMTAPDGTFYSATDADSPAGGARREEGLYFTWTPGELRAALGDDDGKLALSFFSVTEGGNFDGRTVLSTPKSLEIAASELGMSPERLETRIQDIARRLLEARVKRAAPDRDEKVILAWNALAVSALARAALVLGEARYGDAAVRAARVLGAELRAGRRLPHVLVQGKPRGLGFVDDHVLLAAALLDVFELTSDPAWLADAKALMEEVERSFRDTANGGYFLTTKEHESLLVRDKPDYDGPVPSANSVAALTWLRLHELSGDVRFGERAETTLRAFGHLLSNRPLAQDQMLLAVDWASEAPKEIAIVVPEGRGALAPASRSFLGVLERSFVPNAVLVVGSEADFAGELGQRVPFSSGKTLRNGRATAYVCERGSCKLPTTDPEIFAKQIAEAPRYP